MKSTSIIIISFFSLNLFLGSCKDDNINHYIHLAHTRQKDTISQKVHPRVEKMNFRKFDMILLGGDLTEESSKEMSTLDYLDNLFDLGNRNTLWAIGNHDNECLECVKEYTKRDYSFYYKKDGILFVVLCADEKLDWKNHFVGRHLALYNKALEQVDESISHLVVMTHNLSWLVGNPDLKKHVGKKFYDWSTNYRITASNWRKELQPQLLEVKKKGVEVICLAGDIGNNIDYFEEIDRDGIVYLASGLSVTRPASSKYLVFTHDKKNKTLTWKFHHLDTYKPVEKEK